MRSDKLFCYTFVLVACIGAILIIALPGSDHLENCIQRDPSITYFQPIGDGYQDLLYRIFHHEIPLNLGVEDTPTQPELVDTLFNNIHAISAANTPSSSRRINNLLPAWFEFIGHDLYDFVVNVSDPYFGGYRMNHGYDAHGRRTVINYATPRLDGSHLYGVTEALAASIRTLDGSGKLKTSVNSDFVHDNVFMAYNATEDAFLSADWRVTGGNPLVTALYQLFVREHNAWCDKLNTEHPEYTDDYRYEIAKHIVVGEIQAITYMEALPALLGVESKPYCYAGAHHSVQIYSEWAVAALPAFVDTTTDTSPILKSVNTNSPLPSTVTYPSSATNIWEHGLGPLFLGASQQPAAFRDPFLLVFNNDINKVQDALLKDYQTIFAQLFGSSSPHMLPTPPNVTSDHQNLFLGLLLEHKYHNSNLGKLGSWLFVNQFDEIRDHDPYFYTGNPALLKYRQKILHTRLSQIILKHTTIHPALLAPHIFLQ